MKKVALFARVSNHTNAEKALKKQENKIESYCEAHGYSVCDKVGVVGDRKMGYEVLIKLFSSAKEKGIDTIVMESTNRITGTPKELAEVTRAFEGSGVAIEAMDNSHNMSIDPSSVIMSFLASVDEEIDEDFNEAD